MADYLSDKKLISVVAGRLIPEHIRNLNPGFQEFVEGYLRFIEQPGEPYDVITNLFEYTDIDRTSGEYLELFKNQYARYIPDYITTDFSFFIKNIKKILRSKGTQPSFDFFFRYVFEGTIDISYPREQIFKLSDAKWIVPTYLDVIEDIQNDIQYNDSVLYFSQAKIEGVVSGAVAFIQDTELVLINSVSKQLFSLYEPSIIGRFQSGETIKVIESPDAAPANLVNFTITASSINEELLTSNAYEISGDEFGKSISAFSDSIIIGAPGANGLVDVNEGKCYIHDLKYNNAVIEVTPSDIAINNRFGDFSYSDNDQVLISSKDSLLGAVYLFNKFGTQLNKFVASDSGVIERVSNSNFGESLALKNDKLIIGAQGATITGKAYFYSSDGSNDALIQPTDVTDVEEFGKSVAINNNKIYVSSDYTALSAVKESVYIFDYDNANLSISLSSNDISFDSALKRISSVSTIDFSVLVPGNIITILGSSLNDNTYSISQVFSNYITVSENIIDEILGALVQISKSVGEGAIQQFKMIQGSDTSQGDGFGDAILATDSNIIVGCPKQSSNIGAVYIYDNLGNNEIKITSPDSVVGGLFGAVINISDEGNILVSSLNDSKVYVYGISGNHISTVTPSTVDNLDMFGVSVAFSSDKIFVGAHLKDGSGADTGAIYKFSNDLVNSSIISKPGYYKDRLNTLSNGSVFQDSFFYQDFSYVIQSPVSSNLYKPWLDKFAHPAAYKNFTEVIKIPGAPLDAGMPTDSQILYTLLTISDGLKSVGDTVQETISSVFQQTPLRDELQNYWNHNINFIDSKRTYRFYEFFRETDTKGFMTIRNLDDEIIGDFATKATDILNYASSIPILESFRTETIDANNYYEGYSAISNDDNIFTWKILKFNHNGSGDIINVTSPSGNIDYSYQWSDRLNYSYQ